VTEVNQTRKETLHLIQMKVDKTYMYVDTTRRNINLVS